MGVGAVYHNDDDNKTAVWLKYAALLHSGLKKEQGAVSPVGGQPCGGGSGCGGVSQWGGGVPLHDNDNYDTYMTPFGRFDLQSRSAWKKKNQNKDKWKTKVPKTYLLWRKKEKKCN